MLTSHRFRRFEAALLGVLEPAVAGLICEIVAAQTADSSPDLSSERAEFVVDGYGIDLDALATNAGQTRSEAYAFLFDAHQKSQTALGFELFEPSAMRNLGLERARGTAIELSSHMRSLIEGTAHSELAHKPRPELRPDTATRKGLDILTAACASEAGLRFLWRIGSAPESGCAQLEINRLAEGLKYLAGDKSVLTAKQELNPSRLEYPPVLVALSSILHSDCNTMLVLPLPANFLKSGSGQSSDDDFRGPEDERPPARPELGSGADKLFRLLPKLDCTTIVVIPENTVLEPDIAALFSGAFGPYRLDRDSALAAIKLLSPRDFLGDNQAQKVLEAAGDPAFAREILRGAAAIAWATSETIAEVTRPVVRGDGAREAKTGLHVTDLDGRMSVKVLERLYNNAAEDLALSIRPHIARSAALRGVSNEPFDPDLFCADPDPRFLFERAHILRETGARIILAGPSGTGKSALAGHLARLMKLDIKQYGGASLFARAWGQTEKNIAEAATAGRDYLTFYDEADALMGNRFTGSDINQHLTVSATNAFLSAYQDPIHGSPVIAATNRVDDLDPAIRRRFDIILTTKVLPEERELIAWQRILKLEPPAGWKPAGDTVPGDYVKAARYLELAGTRDAIIAAASIVRARNERQEEGIPSIKNPVGFT
jgi:energy-coupling factor transporter ATP-binding protein EcfA2